MGRDAPPPGSGRAGSEQAERPVAWLTCELSPSLRRPLARRLRRAGVDVFLPSEAPDGCGVVGSDEVTEELCDLVRDRSRHGRDRVLVVALGATVAARDQWRLLDAGASDVLVWDHHSHPAEDVAARIARWHDVDEIVRSSAVRDRLVGDSLRWLTTLREIVEVSRFSDSSILITGESGTGKELVAGLIHELDARDPKEDLVVLDCTTVVPTLSGSEFFGHERGAFTGAVAHRAGAFELADRGTLFLDEVGDLSPELQAELLRVVQEGTFKRIGSNTWRKTRFRLVCATNRDLMRDEAEGRFRRDFYYRIAAWTCQLPPLRDRRGDIAGLTDRFIGEADPQLTGTAVSPAVRELLRDRDYPGNVRDLRQLVIRIAARHVGPGPISVGDVPPEERPRGSTVRHEGSDGMEEVISEAISAGAGFKDLVDMTRDTAVRVALAIEHGNASRAARRLGLTPRTVQLRRSRRDRSPGRAAG
jgi:transcriptional regulator with GAF, ATPase, and Fis domain